MGYGSKSLNDLRDDALRIATEHGFTDASVVEDIALMHSEISEALEEYRAGHPVDVLRFEDKQGNVAGQSGIDGKLNKPCGFPSELADVIIRILHFSGKHKIDIEGAVRAKMLYNEERPFKHGGKVI